MNVTMWREPIHAENEKKKQKIVSVIINGDLFSKCVAAKVINYKTCQVKEYEFVKSIFFSTSHFPFSAAAIPNDNNNMTSYVYIII